MQLLITSLAWLCLLDAAPAASPPAQLEGYTLPPAAAVTGDGEGGVVAWLHTNGQLVRWDGSGRLRQQCSGDDPALAGERGPIAAQEDRVLVLLLDHPAGDEQGRRAAVVDMARCRVLVSYALPGLTLEAAGLRGGWALVSSPGSLADGAPEVWLADARGRPAQRFDLARARRELAERLGLSAEEVRGSFKLVATAQELWVLPHARYELWRPPQRGRPLRVVQPPACLAATGRLLTGEENVAYVTAFASRLSEPHRSAILRGVKQGGLKPSFRAAVTAVSSYRGLVAVVVRSPATGEADRFDLWDLAGERVLASTPFPGASTLVSLADGFAWVRDGEGTIRRWPLPDVDPLAEFHCPPSAVEE